MKQKKKSAKPGLALSSVRQTSRERDMRVFHRTTNWAELWDQWYTATDRDGGPKYKYLSDFTNAKAKGTTQRDFMAWFLGPAPDPDDATYESPYKWCKAGPQDWVEKRKTGGWFTDASLGKLSKAIRIRMTALEALREAGNGVTLHSLTRAEQLAQELDRSFGGRMFLEGGKFEDNVRRAEMYLSLHKQILNMKAQAQDLYAKSHGVNFEDMSGLTVLLQAASMSSGSLDEGTNRNKAALTALVDMAVQKSQKYGLELPAGAVEVMGEAAIKVDKKKGLQ